MNFYETMYIVHPALQAGRLDDIVDNINKKIDGLKGKRLYANSWGKKKLAYAINKQKYGTYVLVQFEMLGEEVQELSNEFEHNTNILRYLINKIEKSEVLEEKETASDKALSKKTSEIKEKKDEQNTDGVEEKIADQNNDAEKNTKDNTKELKKTKE